MKKILLTVIGSVLAANVFAQGSLSGVQTMFSNDGITTAGANASNPNTATTWYTGSLTFALYYSAAPSSAGSVSAINSYDVSTGGSAGAALSLLTSANGWALASATSVTSTTAGTLSGAASVGSFSSATPNVIGLVGVPTGGSGSLALVVTGANGIQGVLAWVQSNLGGNPNGAPPGTPAAIVQDPSGLNLVLQPVTATPEPGTMALAALGGASLLLFRRKK